MMHIKIEKIIIGNTQPVLENDLPYTSPEGPLKVLMFGTYRGSSRDTQGVNAKFDDFRKKLFTGRTNIQSSKRGCPRDVYEAQLEDVPGNK